MDKQVQAHLDSIVPDRPNELVLMEQYAADMGFPIIGPTVGYLCYQIARMIKARNIFEMGSGYGYSTAWFAKAVKENGGGKVHHVVWDRDLSKQAQRHLSRLGLEKYIQFSVGEAVSVLSSSRGPYDLIFNDIDKEDYPESLHAIKDKLSSGGVLLMDNMLWEGRIFDEKDTTPSTQGVRRSTEMLVSDEDWIVTVVPIRDGVLIAYKK